MDFSTRYAKLNDNQRQAVDTINGPLLVIAGPGTGKTELLSMRATQILRQTDTLPSNILCLTFTDSGAVNMRRRLQQIIGEDAYKIAIHTFHSFGTDIIAQHREYFFRGADAQPIDDIMQHEILHRLFEQLDWQHPLSSRHGDEFTYLKDALRVIAELKQSGLSPNELRQILADNQRIMSAANPLIAEAFDGRVSKATIEKVAHVAEHIAGLETPSLPAGTKSYAEVVAASAARAVREALETDSTKPITAWKNAWCSKNASGQQELKDTAALEKLSACVDLYEQYMQVLTDEKRFDYDDMILSVLRALETAPELRANLQEQYQYIMVDEFQDTNLAQLRLLFELTGDDPQANIMAVGDDDQAIFSFQGADVGNIQRFRRHYHDPRIIVLTDNYRSAAPILQAARQVITQGLERLEDTIPDLSKKLTPHAEAQQARVRLREYPSIIEERAGVADAISHLIQTGTSPSDIAVLARRHHELIDLLPYMMERGIAVDYERRDNVFEQPVVRLVERLARVVAALADGRHDDANALLPEVIAHPAFGFSARDIWQLSLQSYKNRTGWLETMLSSSTFQETAGWLLERARQVDVEDFEQQLDALLAPLRDHFFGADTLATQPDAYVTALSALRTLRDRVRDHYADRRPTLRQFISLIDLYNSMNARLTSLRPSAQGAAAVHLMSAHKAKGLEFPHVFVIGAIDSAWGEKVRDRSRLIRYPANLPLAPAGATYDERLRLFFVAMTRAKTTLDISYARTDRSGKDSLVASFLSHDTPDVVPDAPDIASATDTLEADWRARLTSPLTADLRTVLAPTLEHYKLSATHLNNFLDISTGGPQHFLLSSLLHFPQAKAPSAGYGTAMHQVLATLHDTYRADGALLPTAEALDLFTAALEAQHLPEDDFATYNDKGRTALAAFLQAHGHDFRASQRAELDLSSQGVMLGEARLTGKLDLVDIDKTAKTLLVTDYKTGKAAASWTGKGDYEKIKLHKYRQQLMFYQLLLEHSRDYAGYEFTGGRLQFVEPERQSGNIVALDAQFSRDELDDFARLIQAVWRRIMTLDMPDVSAYSADYKGVLAFEKDLLSEEL